MIAKAKILKVKYRNGDEDIFNTTPRAPATSNSLSLSAFKELTARNKKVLIKSESDELSGLTSEVKNLVNNRGYCVAT